MVLYFKFLLLSKKKKKNNKKKKGSASHYCPSLPGTGRPLRSPLLGVAGVKWGVLFIYLFDIPPGYQGGVGLRSGSASTFAGRSTAFVFLPPRPLDPVFLGRGLHKWLLSALISVGASVCFYLYPFWQIELYPSEQTSSNWFIFAGFRRRRVSKEPRKRPPDVAERLRAAAEQIV